MLAEQSLVLLLFAVGIYLIWWVTRRSRYTVCGGRRDLGDTTIELILKNMHPPVLVGDGFVTAEEANEIIMQYEAQLIRSTVYREDGSSENHDSRTSSTAFLPPGVSGSVLEKVERRAATLLGVPVQHLELLQLLRYEPSQKYEPHVDFFRAGPDSTNNRTHTALLYLNDLELDDKGGGTHFPKIDLEVRPVTGRVVVWQNCSAPHGVGARPENCDEGTLHGGKSPECSVKYAMNIWARNLPAR